MVEELIPVVQSAQWMFYEQVVGRVRGIISGRLTSSICYDGMFIFLQKEKQDQVAQSLRHTPFWPSLHWVHKWALFLLFLFILQAKTPMLASFTHQCIFVQSALAKDFSVLNWHGRGYLQLGETKSFQVVIITCFTLFSEILIPMVCLQPLVLPGFPGTRHFSSWMSLITAAHSAA